MRNSLLTAEDSRYRCGGVMLGLDGDRTGAFVRGEQVAKMGAMTPHRSNPPPRIAAISALLVVLGWNLLASADPLFVSLSYDVDAGIRGCPTEGDLRSAVGTQLGYDPFRPEVTRHLLAQVQPSEGGLDGMIIWSDAAGTREGQRRFFSSTRNCGELVQGMAFAISVRSSC